MSIDDIKSKIKSFRENFIGSDLYVVFIVIIVAFGSFGLGRLSISNTEQKLIQIPSKVEVNLANAAESQKTLIPTNKQFVASKRGKKYYPTDCSSAQSIKVENKIYFNSSTEAEQAGYSASISC